MEMKAALDVVSEGKKKLEILSQFKKARARFLCFNFFFIKIFHCFNNCLIFL